MSTILSHTRLPLWAWIVILGFGSVFIIAAILTIWRCWYIRRKSTEGFRLENSQSPTRRVTVRRGRLVPASHYLSLTGSKFGLNQFNNAVEDAADKERARSKSPFEWWNTILDRSQSRQGEMNQAGRSRMRNLSTPDIEARPPQEKVASPVVSPNLTRQQRKLPISPANTSSMASLTKNKPTAQTNFSRSFVPTQHPGFSLPSLRQIEAPLQKRPHRSKSEGRLKSDTKTQASQVSTAEITGPESPGSPLPLSLTMSPVQTQSFLNSPCGSSSAFLTSKVASTAPVAKPELSRQVSKPKSESGLRNEYRSSRTQSTSSQPSQRPSYRSSSLLEQAQDHAELSRRESLPSNSISNSHSRSALSYEHAPERERSQYWDTRPDLMPVRRPSKKGNVLRKKSLRRSEMVSWVDS